MSAQHIHVVTQPSTPHYAFSPYYDTEADLLTISSKGTRAWKYGVDIDGTIIFDIDTYRILANIDLLIPRRLWHVLPALEAPRAIQQVDVMFSEATIASKSFHLSMKVNTDITRTYIDVSFDELIGHSTWYALSGTCFARIIEDQLCGLFVILRDNV